MFCTHGLKGMCIGALELPECSSKDVSEESAACLSRCAVIAAIDIMRMVDVCYFFIIFYFENISNRVQFEFLKNQDLKFCFF